MEILKATLSSGANLIKASRELIKVLKGNEGKTQRDKAIEKLEEIQNLHEKNLTNLKRPSRFVAGARPAILWVCAIGLAWHFLGLSVVLGLAAWCWGMTPTELEGYRQMLAVDDEALFSLTAGLLGLGGMRSYEKFKGVARDNIKG